MPIIHVTFSDEREPVLRRLPLETVILTLLQEYGESVIVHSPTDLEVYNTWRE